MWFNLNLYESSWTMGVFTLTNLKKSSKGLKKVESKDSYMWIWQNYLKFSDFPD